MKNQKFHKYNLIKLYKLPQKQREMYFRDLRKFNYDNNIMPKFNISRKILHRFLLFGLKINKIIKGEKLVIVDNKSIRTNRPTIFACTHIGGHDVEMSCEAVGQLCYLFIGDPGEMYLSPLWFLLSLNGVIFLDTDSKTDRHIAKETAIRYLKNKNNLLIFPEGAWNITENEPVMKLYTGTIEMAILADADIVPVALEEYDNTYYVNIGKNIRIKNADLKKKDKYTKRLRDVLCTLKWEIWEKYGKSSRDSIPPNYSDIYPKIIESKSDVIFPLSEVRRTMYISNEDKILNEIRELNNKLKPNLNNLFLFKSH